MASFAPFGTDQRPEDFTRLSQGYRDSTVGELLKDVGETIGAGVKAADDTFKKLIRDDARAISDDIQNGTIDELQQASGVGTARMRADRTPDEIARFVERARRFQSGVNSGNVKESSYWAMLDTGARQLRSRYPGYRDTIDQAFQEFTGQVPANALIRELRQDAEQALKAGKSGQDVWLKQVQENIQRGYYSAEQAAKIFANPSEYPLPRLLMDQAQFEKRKADTAIVQSEYTLRSSAGQANDRDRAELARASFAEQFHAWSQQKDSVYTRSDAERRKIMEDTRGRVPTPQETQRVAELARVQMAELDQMYQGFITQPRNELGGKSFVSLPEKERKELRDYVDETKKAIEKSIFDPQSGWTTQASDAVKLLGDFTTQRLLGQDNVAYFYGIRKVLGDDVFGTILTHDRSGPLGLNQLHRVLTNISVAKLADPSQPQSFQRIAQDAAAKGLDGKGLEAMVQSAVGTIADERLPMSARIQMVEKMYGPDNRTFLELVKRGGVSDREGQLKIFNQMANPQVAKSLSKFAKESGNPKVWDRYEQWVLDQTFALNSADIGSVAKAQLDAPGVNITFSPNSFAFAVSERDLPPTDRPGENPAFRAARAIDNAWQRSRVPDLNKAVSDLNKAIAPLKDIAEHYASDKEEYAKVVLSRMGARMQSEAQGPSTIDSFITKMSKYINTTSMYQRSEEIRKAREDAAAKGNLTSSQNSGNAILDFMRGLLPDQTQTDRERNKVR